MERSLNRLEQLSYLVVRQPWGQPHRTRRNDHRLALLGSRLCHANPQIMVYRIFERSSTAPDFLFQLLSNIFIESECSAHIMMLASKHHDVNMICIPVVVQI